MNSSAYLTLREDVVSALREHRLLDALTAVEGQLAYAGCWHLRQAASELREDYERLLAYFKQGVEDPSREAQHLSFLRRIYEVSEQIHRDFLMAHSGLHRARVWEQVAASYRKTEGSFDLIAVLADTLGGEADYQVLFDVAWTMGAWTDADTDAALSFVEQPATPLHQQTALLGAVMLALFSSFDAHRFAFLLRLLEAHAPEEQYDRALVGIVLTALRHEEILPLYPDLEERIRRLVMADGRFAERMRLLQKSLLAVEYTSSFARKMERELIPELLAIGWKPSNTEAPESEGAQPGASERLMSISKKVQRTLATVFEMQQLGVDTTFFSFRQAAQRMDFFAREANWFAACLPDHPLTVMMDQMNEQMHEMVHRRQCDTDRLAFLEFFRRHPIKMTVLPTEGNGGEPPVAADEKDTLPPSDGTPATAAEGAPAMERFSFEATSSEPPSSVSDARSMAHGVSFEFVFGGEDDSHAPERTLCSVLQDLHRYFRLFRYRVERESPFQANLFLPDHPLFAPLYTNDEDYGALAAFTFRLGDYAHAETCLRRIKADADVLCSLAFALERQKKWDEAIALYEQVLPDEAHSEWCISRLVGIYEQRGRFEDALVLLYRLEAQRPDNVALLHRLAYCFIRVELYSDAVDRLFKILYFHPNDRHALKLLAWSLMMLRRFDEATDRFNELLSDEPQANDFFNAGHNAWLSGEVSTAAALYVECLKAKGERFAPRDFFDDDRTDLFRLGLTSRDLQLMIDLINTEMRL